MKLLAIILCLGTAALAVRPRQQKYMDLQTLEVSTTPPSTFALTDGELTAVRKTNWKTTGTSKDQVAHPKVHGKVHRNPLLAAKKTFRRKAATQPKVLKITGRLRRTPKELVRFQTSESFLRKTLLVCALAREGFEDDADQVHKILQTVVGKSLSEESKRVIRAVKMAKTSLRIATDIMWGRLWDDHDPAYGGKHKIPLQRFVDDLASKGGERGLEILRPILLRFTGCLNLTRVLETAARLRDLKLLELLVNDLRADAFHVRSLMRKVVSSDGNVRAPQLEDPSSPTMAMAITSAPSKLSYVAKKG